MVNNAGLGSAVPMWSRKHRFLPPVGFQLIFAARLDPDQATSKFRLSQTVGQCRSRERDAGHGGQLSFDVDAFEYMFAEAFHLLADGRARHARNSRRAWRDIGGLAQWSQAIGRLGHHVENVFDLGYRIHNLHHGRSGVSIGPFDRKTIFLAGSASGIPVIAEYLRRSANPRAIGTDLQILNNTAGIKWFSGNGVNGRRLGKFAGRWDPGIVARVSGAGECNHRKERHR